MTTRRNFVHALGVCVLTPLVALAQQGRAKRIGFLWERDQSDADYIQRLEAFKAGLRALGYAEGRDYVVEHRSAQGSLANLPAAAVELVALNVDLIVTSGTPSARASVRATGEIPALVVAIGDPVGAGLAATLARPGGNVTGLTGSTAELVTQRLELLRQLQPGLARVGFLYDPDNIGNVLGLGHFESACARLGLKPLRAVLRGADDIAPAFSALQRDKAQALVVSGGSTNQAWQRTIIRQAANRRLPAIYNSHFFVEAGGFISYAANEPELYRSVAAHADRIFKGAKPGDLPIEQPTRFELVVNMKTARALGITIPQSILVRADRVIE